MEKAEVVRSLPPCSDRSPQRRYAEHTPLNKHKMRQLSSPLPALVHSFSDCGVHGRGSIGHVRDLPRPLLWSCYLTMKTLTLTGPWLDWTLRQPGRDRAKMPWLSLSTPKVQYYCDITSHLLHFSILACGDIRERHEWVSWQLYCVSGPAVPVRSDKRVQERRLRSLFS